MNTEQVIDNRASALDTRKVPKTGLDYYPTPPSATRMFMDRLQSDLCIDFSNKDCIEPAAGGGHMSEALKPYFKRVWALDINDYGYPLDHKPIDFCSPMERRAAFDSFGIPSDGTWLITNPPFNRAEEFVLGAMDLGIKNLAFLVRLQFIEGGGRYDNLFSKRPPNFVYAYSRRINLTHGGSPSGGKMAFAWYVWQDGAEDTRLRWLGEKVSG